ncbi:hypothetical protein N3K66_002931 [Trichothecium roseum]|uniref:Uncharacterized protein n=1 Tax=Trichothecium roseum TaxID=47278 RepID=A0ACC0V5W3_9HYPO|nr:hypothetical protein N3K66_002931 [Trichothecium roseum]
MKVIVTGATGTAGRGIVKACLEDDRITEVIILTRRAVSGSVESHPKVQVVMHHDFSQYPDNLMDKLAGAEACLWAIGGTVTQFNGDKEACRRVGVTYTMAAARAMQARLASHLPATQGKFRFVFCSGKFSEWNRTKPLFFMADSRRIKGEIEQELCGLGDAHAANFQMIGGLYQGIGTDQLGRAMVRLAVEGYKDRIVPNETLIKLGSAKKIKSARSSQQS